MKKQVCTGLLLLFTFGMQAQFDTQLSNYWAAMHYYNPAYAGQTPQLELTGLYRMQWIGVEHAPKTGIVLATMPFSFFGREHGLGAVMYNDQIGLFKANVISGQYAFKMKLFGGSLGIGLQGGYINETFDGTKVHIPNDNDYHNSTDEAIPLSEVSGKSIDLAAGIYYTDSLQKWYVGLSATHLIEPKLELNETYILDVPRSYYFTAGYNIPLSNPLLELRSSVLLKATEVSSLSITEDSMLVAVKPNSFKGLLTQTQVDVSLRLAYAKMLWCGLSWRKGESVILLLGGKFKSIEFGYAYDIPVFSDLIRSTSGSHELYIKYAMDLNLSKEKKGKYKSVRIL
ncbi:MAG: type IX secretion system membrane protein PorP/SprF [Candidatus Symbiothrix sp.]|jgi:type IX secretion system PorP/SprF family membrane protein|nr:type IX secretion system membrane protein PorP/SprF [Candidatus Symbiothrix sp.]